MTEAKMTIDHDEIRRWVEARGGRPAHVIGTDSNGDPGVLRIEFTGFRRTTYLEPITWDEFFDGFDENELAFLYQDEEESRFSKIIAREDAQLE